MTEFDLLGMQIVGIDPDNRTLGSRVPSSTSGPSRMASHNGPAASGWAAPRHRERAGAERASQSIETSPARTMEAGIGLTGFIVAAGSDRRHRDTGYPSGARGVEENSARECGI